MLALKQAAMNQLNSLSKSKAIQDLLLDSLNVDKYKVIDIKNVEPENVT